MTERTPRPHPTPGTPEYDAMIQEVAFGYTILKWLDGRVPNPFEPAKTIKRADFLFGELMEIYTRRTGPASADPAQNWDYHTPYWALVQNLRRFDAMRYDQEKRATLVETVPAAELLAAQLSALAANLPPEPSFQVFTRTHTHAAVRPGELRDVDTAALRSALTSSADDLSAALQLRAERMAEDAAKKLAGQPKAPRRMATLRP